MLLCRACNTRFEETLRACPRCGRRTTESVGDASASGGPLLDVGDTGPLSPARPMEEEVGIDLELGEQDVLEEQAVRRSPRVARPRRKPEPPGVGRVREPGPSVLGLEPMQVRSLVTEQPGLLEKGLGIHSDDAGHPIGVDFATPVGEIDLLARDMHGDLVVVMVPAPSEFDSIVPDMVQRIGWVRKHVAEGDHVRGIVVLQELPEAVGYAAAGVAGMVSFKTFRVALTFLEIQP